VKLYHKEEIDEVRLKVEWISKSFSGRRIFSNIHFELKKRESLVLTGENGSGKTTLLRILAGLLCQDSGKIEFEINRKLIQSEKRRAYLGFVTPEINLYEELSAIENLIFFSQVRGFTKSKESEMELLRRVGLEGREKDIVVNFSSGMKQRLKFGFAIQGNPLILLLDEPGGHLDDNGRVILEEIVKEQRENGILIIATNDEREISYGEKLLKLG